MERKKRSELITQLKQAGFRKMQDLPGLYVDQDGKVFNVSGNCFERLYWSQNIQVDGKYHNVPKLILQTFCNIPYRDCQRVRFIDGNKSNMNVDNLQYVTPIPPEPVDYERLYTAIRCHFNVPKKYNVKDILQTKLYLSRTLVILGDDKTEHIDIFKEYLSDSLVTRVQLAEKYELWVVDVEQIINYFINQIVDKTLRLMDAGILHVLDYSQAPKGKSICKDTG